MARYSNPIGSNWWNALKPTNFSHTQMNYDYFRQAGYPIGSGTVESGINTVVHHRMKRQGRGWKRQNAQAMLAALSELHSRRFQAAWQPPN
jgi:hypothetical protein